MKKIILILLGFMSSDIFAQSAYKLNKQKQYAHYFLPAIIILFLFWVVYKIHTSGSKQTKNITVGIIWFIIISFGSYFFIALNESERQQIVQNIGDTIF